MRAYEIKRVWALWASLEITLVARDVTTPRKYPSRLSLVCKNSNFYIHFDPTRSKMVRLA